MRDLQEMIEELQEKVGAITRQEQKEHRAAGEEFDEARKLLEAARGYNRQMLFYTEDEGRNDLRPVYQQLIFALEKVAETHIERGDVIVNRMAQRNKSVKIDFEALSKE